MPRIQSIFQWFYDLSLGDWIGFSLASNFLIFVVSVGACWFLQKRFVSRRLFETPQPISAKDGLLAFFAVLLNSGVSIVGWLLWKWGFITLTFPAAWRVVGDLLLFLFIMDLGMYAFHRIAHIPWIFSIVHRAHHTHESTNPISLFVLNPFEVMGFGGLMIAVLCLLPFSAVAVVIYLNLNMAFGTIGHLGAEIFPPTIIKYFFFKQVGTSTFHGGHHADPNHNFGFYTVIWDRIFGTISPDYDARLVGNRPAEQRI